jgi:hypothetical protein
MGFEKDVKEWEEIAYAWLCDAKDDVERAAAWARFLVAYPEHAIESHLAFWERIILTEWYKLMNKQENTPLS